MRNNVLNRVKNLKASGFKIKKVAFDNRAKNVYIENIIFQTV